jgi:hypothetical protein
LFYENLPGVYKVVNKGYDSAEDDIGKIYKLNFGVCRGITSNLGVLGRGAGERVKSNLGVSKCQKVVTFLVTFPNPPPPPIKT